MRLAAFVLTLAAPAFAALAPAPSRAEDFSTVAARVDRSIGRVFVETAQGTGSGSGFVVQSDADGTVLFITNHHVVEGGSDIQVIFKDGDNLAQYEGRVLQYTADVDIALLQLTPTESSYSQLQPIEIAVRHANKGEPVAAFGYPGVSDELISGELNIALFDSTLTEGIVSKILVTPWRTGGEDVELVQHSAHINFGNSGGPLIDACGQVLGLNTAMSSAAPEISLASSSVDLAWFLKQSGVAYGTADSDCGAAYRAQPEPANPAPAPRAPDAPETARPATPPLFGPAGGLGGMTSGLVVLGAVAAIFAVIALAVTKLSPSRDPVATGAKVSMIIRLQDGSGKSVSIPISKESLTRGVTIGRGSEADIPVSHTAISRTHLRLSLDGRRLYATDLGSTNGTTIDGTPLPPQTKRQIVSTSRIRLGNEVDLSLGVPE